MTSFFAKSIGYISHQPETVSAILATSRSLMNCSIVPVLLSDDELWDSLCSSPFSTKKQENLLRLFSTFSDTMQFTEKLRLPAKPRVDGLRQQPQFINRVQSAAAVAAPPPLPIIMTQVLENLINNKRYFTRTIKHIDFQRIAVDDDDDDDEKKIFSSSSCAKNNSNNNSCVFRNLRSIGLKRCASLKREQLKIICKNFTLLEKLDLSYQQLLHNDDFACISNLKCLRELSLEETGVEDLPFLKHLKFLQKLDLTDCGDLETSAFVFDDDDECGGGGGGDGEFSSSLLLLPCLQELILEGCYRLDTDIVLDNLQRHAPNMTSLVCEKPESKEAFAAIASFSQLRNLDIHVCRHLTEEVLENMMTKLCSLTSLSFRAASFFNDECLIKLSQTTSPIQKLVLSSANFSDRAFSYLTSLKHLETLDIRTHGNAQFTGDMMNNDDNNKKFSNSLKDLKIAGCKLKGLQSLMKSIDYLQSLKLQWSPEITSECLLKAFQTSKSKNTLTFLDVSYPRAGGIRDLSFCRELPALKILDLGSTKLDYPSMRGENNNDEKGFGALPESLEKLLLDSTDIKDDDIACFPTEKLAKNLYHLSLHCAIKLTDRCLIESVSKLRNLSYLSTGAFEKSVFTVEGACCVLEQLPRLTSLKIGKDLQKKIEADPVLLKRFAPLISS